MPLVTTVKEKFFHYRNGISSVENGGSRTPHHHLTTITGPLNQP